MPGTVLVFEGQGATSVPGDPPLDLTALRGDLSRVGKAVVEVELAARADAHLAQLVAQAVPLFLQAVAQRRMERLGHGTEAYCSAREALPGNRARGWAAS